jgi:hypothetical protein
MNLRDKVAAIFSTDSTSASSDEGCDAMISSKDRSVRFREQAQLCDVASRLAPPPLQPQSPFLEPSHSQALATPAPQKHPQPASHVSDNVSGIHASLPPPTPCGRAAEQRPLPHVALLMMRKGALDSIASRNFNLPEQAVALLLAASSMVLPLGNFDWQHVRSLIRQRRFVQTLARAPLDIDPRSPALLLPRKYLQQHAAPPGLKGASEASHGLAVIHNWLVGHVMNTCVLVFTSVLCIPTVLAIFCYSIIAPG